MLRLPLLPLPKSTEARLVLGIVVLGLCLAMAGRRITQLEAALKARPEIMDGSVDHRTEDVRRGPVKVTRTVKTEADGTRTVNSVREEGVTEIKKTFDISTTHKEVPWDDGEPTKRTRYLGLGVDTQDYLKVPRVRAGLTFLGALDAGVATDFKRLWIETAYRF